jgi:small ligand-binding sensory domain FIST
MIATALACADRADPELAAEAVRTALGRAGADIARGVLLFLSTDFVHQAHAAVLAASRAGRCLQVTGCTAPGVFTEEDWVLDRPAACAMVFAGGCGPAAHPEDGAPLLTLATPNAAGTGWLEGGGPRYGLLSTDNSAHGAGRIWCHGKMAAEGRCEAAFAGVRAAVGVSRGMRILGEPRPVGGSGRDVLRVGDHPALNALLRELPLDMREMEKLPFHLLAAGLVRGEAAGAIDEGRYTLVPIIGVNHDERSVALALPLDDGDRIFWALRQALAAENDMRRLADELPAAARQDAGLRPALLLPRPRPLVLRRRGPRPRRDAGALPRHAVRRRLWRRPDRAAAGRQRADAQRRRAVPLRRRCLTRAATRPAGFFIDAWRKHRAKQLVSPLEDLAIRLVAEHPEYHGLLEDREAALAREWTPEGGESNPFLHLSLHLAIEEQLSIDQPPGLRAAFEALLARRGERHAALHDVLECLGETMWQARRKVSPRRTARPTSNASDSRAQGRSAPASRHSPHRSRHGSPWPRWCRTW